MKKLSKILLMGFCLILLPIASFAQSPKFGHINSDELIGLMPERDSAIITLKKYADEMQETYDEIQVELQNKLTTYQQRLDTWTAAVRAAREEELNELSDRLQRYQQNAQTEFNQLNDDLFRPIYAKANSAIQKVGKDGGFIYIYDMSSGTILYTDLAQSEDILPLVKRELGIPAEKVAPSVIQ